MTVHTLLLNHWARDVLCKKGNAVSRTRVRGVLVTREVEEGLLIDKVQVEQPQVLIVTGTDI